MVRHAVDVDKGDASLVRGGAMGHQEKGIVQGGSTSSKTSLAEGIEGVKKAGSELGVYGEWDCMLLGESEGGPCSRGRRRVPGRNVGVLTYLPWHE